MKRIFRIARSRRSLFLALAFFPLCFGILIRGAGPSTLQSITRADQVANKTKTLEVVFVQPLDDNRILIRVKNISTKDLNGYEVDVRGHARITTDFSAGNAVIPPGGTHEFDLPAEYSLSNITILAAMFADGTIEGDSMAVTELKQQRLALKKKLTQALPLFEAALESPDVYTPEVLDRLESQLSSLLLESDTSPRHSTSQSRAARDDLIDDVKRLRERRRRNGAHMQRQRLLDLKARIEKRIASL